MSDEIQKSKPAVPARAATTGESMWKYAQALSRADIIPKQYQGSPANCFVALDMAQRLGTGVMEIMQNTFVVHGTPGFSAKYAIGMANKKGPFKGPISFEYSGAPGYESVTAYAIVAETGNRVEFTADMEMAKAEGWAKHPKYKTGLARLMLSYRSATFLIRLYCPQVLLGMQTTEELEDMYTSRHHPGPEQLEATAAQVVEVLNQEVSDVGDLPPDEQLAVPGPSEEVPEIGGEPDGQPPTEMF